MKAVSLTGAQNSAPAERPGSNMQSDPICKNIQNRIANLRERLQSISSDENMTAEDKMKKRQEIQQEISNLNQQIRQREIEQRKEQQAKKAPAEDFPKPKRKSGKRSTGLSQASMQAMISADSSVKQAEVQGSVASAMDGRAGVLKAEIKQDAGRDNSDKKAELAEVEQKSADATASQMGTLAEAEKSIKEAASAEAENADAENKSDKAEKTGKKDGKTPKTDSKDENKSGVKTAADGNPNAGKSDSKPAAAEPGSNVDVRL